MASCIQTHDNILLEINLEEILQSLKMFSFLKHVTICSHKFTSLDIEIRVKILTKA